MKIKSIKNENENKKMKTKNDNVQNMTDHSTTFRKQLK